jgi:hypothetical protein
MFAAAVNALVFGTPQQVSWTCFRIKMGRDRSIRLCHTARDGINDAPSPRPM